MARAHQRLAHAVHITLVLHAITDQLSHRQNFQIVSTAKIDQVGNTCHAPVVAHDLADDSCWNKPCEASQVHRRLRLPSTHQDAALTCSQRSEEHTSELQSRLHLVCRLLLEKKKKTKKTII